MNWRPVYWLLTIVLGLIGLALVLILFAIPEARRNADAIMQRNTMLREQQLLASMSEALEVEFDISSVEADCYARIYRKWARLKVVEWTRLAAVTYIESHFDPTLTSHAGAQGLMQLMKPTREGLCLKRPCSNGNTTAWRDVLNLDLGCEYLAGLINKHGDTLGIAAYNVGEANLDTFRLSQRAFTDSVFKYDRRLALVFEGIKARSTK